MRMPRQIKEPRRKIKDWDKFCQHLRDGGSYRFWSGERNHYNKLHHCRAVVDYTIVVTRTWSIKRHWTYTTVRLQDLYEHFRGGHLYWPT